MTGTRQQLCCVLLIYCAENSNRNRCAMRRFLGLLSVCASLSCLSASPALASRCDDKDPAFTRRSVVAIFKRDGISIPIDLRGKLNRLGNIKIGETCYTIYTYEFDFEAASNTQHTARVLVLRERKYIGM